MFMNTFACISTLLRSLQKTGVYKKILWFKSFQMKDARGPWTTHGQWEQQQSGWFMMDGCIAVMIRSKYSILKVKSNDADVYLITE